MEGYGQSEKIRPTAENKISCRNPFSGLSFPSFGYRPVITEQLPRRQWERVSRSEFGARFVDDEHGKSKTREPREKERAKEKKTDQGLVGDERRFGAFEFQFSRN